MQAQFPNFPAFLNCPLGGTAGCGSGGAGGAASFILSNVIPAVQTLFYAVALIFFLQYAVKLLLESHDESTISEVKVAYTYGIVGAVIVSLAGLIVQAVGPGTGNSLINAAPVNEGLGQVIAYMRIMVGVAATVLITFQGIRIILLQGQESELDMQRKRFFHGLIGVAVILLANSLVSAVLPGSGSSILSDEIAGIANFLTELVGALGVLSFVVAGAMLILSVDEGLKDRAKKAMFTATIAMIVASTAFVIVNYFILL